MRNIIEIAEKLFGTRINYYEAIFEVNATFKTEILPDEYAIIDFLHRLIQTDKTKITILDQAEQSVIISSTENISLWLDDYRKFVAENDDNPVFAVKLDIQKSQSPQDDISIYDLDSFYDFISRKNTVKEQLEIFSTIFAQDRDYIKFNLLNSDWQLFTPFISFSNEEVIWKPQGRKAELKKCNDASAFLDFHTLGLIPQDFHIREATCLDRFVSLSLIFRKLETVLSYAFIASTSYLKDEKLILQIEPGRVLEFDTEKINNFIIPEIFHWTFSEDKCLERASIVRNILRLYCKSVEQFLVVDQEILTSIKSNYVLYQKDSTDKYIELKENIANFIFSNTKQLQELILGLIDGIRNNIIAVFSFLITVLLTNSLSGKELIENGLSRNLVFVFWIFITASIVYWFVTITTTCFKWKFIKKGYTQLKQNYQDILDEMDIETAFSKDNVILDSRNQVLLYAIIISLIWLLFSSVMVILVLNFS